MCKEEVFTISREQFYRLIDYIDKRCKKGYADEEIKQKLYKSLVLGYTDKEIIDEIWKKL